MANKILKLAEQPKYFCPKHGSVGALSIRFTSTEFKGKFNIDKNFCFFCIVESLDKCCCEVTLVEVE